MVAGWRLASDTLHNFRLATNPDHVPLLGSYPDNNYCVDFCTIFGELLDFRTLSMISSDL